MAGYKNYMSGKWPVTRHVRPREKENWPASVGSTGSTGPSSGQAVFDPATLCRENTLVTPVNDPEYKPETYYYTDAISDNAVSFLKEHAKSDGDKPFFLYLAYTTAHWHMHALPEDIEKYKEVRRGVRSNTQSPSGKAQSHGAGFFRYETFPRLG